MGHVIFRALAAVAITAIAAAAASCPLSAATTVAVYLDVNGGVGAHSALWTRAFFDWLSKANPALSVAYVEAAADVLACGELASPSFPALALWVQPGGEADAQSAALGPAGRDLILDFAASAQGHIYATCAGWYFSAGTYWWFDEFFGNAWMPHWWPTVEGPISAIAVYPDFAPTTLSNGLTTIYYGGPALGLNFTTHFLPNGTEVLAYFAHPGVPANVPAIVRYTGPYVDALFASPHPEATAGDLACAPPAPPGCITPQQQLANWRFMAEALATMLKAGWIVPTSL
jgi:hypothetical protein